MATEETTEQVVVADASAATDEKWDEMRQQVDQAQSVATKAREEAETLSAAYTEAQAEIEKLKAANAERQQAIDDKKSELDQMDPDLVDNSVRRNIEKMEKRLEQSEKRAEKLELKARAYEEAETKRSEEARKAEVREKILTPLDAEFGAKFRNKALKLADDLVDSGKEKQPTDPIDGMILLRKCYQQVSSEKKKPSVATDSGASGVSHQPVKRKTGTRDEVFDDMLKDKSWMD
jgi:chromosome segregation ATPase